MATPEQKTQMAAYEWLTMQHPRLAKYFVKIDNEGIRSIGGHINAIKCGLQPKASDVFFAWPVEPYHGLWIEIKADGWKGASGKKQKEHIEGQLAFQANMRAAGYATAFCIGVDKIIATLQLYISGQYQCM
jgi:hypothetical protein